MPTTDPSNPPGQIITFYSYKGGTGRSMALANLACLLGRDLAQTSQRVLLVDWDLEAPGLHRYFSARCELPEFREQEGVANYFYSLLELLLQSPDLYQALTAANGCAVLEKTLPLTHYITPNVVPGVDFMRAGLFNADYARIAGGFNWVNFFNQFGGVIRTFREMLAQNYAYILIDSRTGITDISGICTTLLPEKLVGVFVPNRQSLEGLCDIVRQAIDYRSKTDDDFRPLSVFPLPSRIENAEKDLKDEWRVTYQKTFEALFKKEYQINNCDLTDYFTNVSLPHTSYYAYGEKIAMLEDKVRDAQSLSTAYTRFYDRLFRLDTPWELPEPSPQSSVTASVPAPIRFTEPLYDAFLSYAKPDHADVAGLDAKLRELDVRTFLDTREILPGANYVSAISSAMAASRTVLVFFGPNGTAPWSDQSSLSMLESYAKQPEKRVIPVFLPNAPLNPSRLPPFLSSYLPVEIRSLRDQATIQRIAQAVLATRPAGDLAESTSPARAGSRTWKLAATAAVVLLSVSVGYFGVMRHSASVPSVESPSNSTQASKAPTPNPPVKRSTPSSSNAAMESSIILLGEWGVLISQDKTLEPAAGSKGGPSAEWEPVRAWRAGYKNAVILHHGDYYWTVIPAADQTSAEAVMQKIKTNPPYQNWADASVIDMYSGCPHPHFEKKLQVAEASIDLYECA